MDSSTLFIENGQVPTHPNIREVVRKDYTSAGQFVQAYPQVWSFGATETGKIPPMMDRKRTHQPMNALQRLIEQYLADHPGENHSSIARRAGMSRSTVHSLATVEKRVQTPTPATIASLARGMSMSPDIVRKAAAEAAGYAVEVPTELDSAEGRLVVAAFGTLDEARKRDLARRARFLMEEMRESSGDNGE